MSGRGGLPSQQQYGQYGGNQGYGQQYGGGGYGQQQGYGNYQQQQGYYGQQQQYSQNHYQQQQPSRQYQQQQQHNQYQPQQQQSTSSSSYSSRSTNRNPGMRPPDLQSQNSYDSSNSSTYYNGSTGSSRTPTTPSSPQQGQQPRQQQSLRTNRGFASPEPSPTGQGQGQGQGQQQQQQQSSNGTGATSGGYGTSFWNKVLAAKEVINATISGEERWPDSDDSDYEGESHVARVLREYVEKKEDAAMAEQIAQMELTISQQQQQQNKNNSYGTPNSGSMSSTTKNQSLRDALRKDHSSFASSNSSGDDYYSRSMRSRGKDDRDSNHSGSSGAGGGGINLMNRFRAASDASRNDALNKLEGRNQGDALQAQISHLGSTSPRGQRGGGGGGAGGLSPNSAAGGGDRFGATSPSSMSYSSSSNSLREAYQNRNRSNTTQPQQYGSGGRYF